MCKLIELQIKKINNIYNITMNNITKINNYLSNIQREHGKPKKILLFRIPTINYNSFDIT